MRYRQEPTFTSFNGGFHEEPSRTSAPRRDSCAALWINAPTSDKTLSVETRYILFERYGSNHLILLVISCQKGMTRTI